VGSQSESLTAAQICAETGISARTFVRRREDGLVQIVSRSRGLGPRRGKTAYKYSPASIATLRRFEQLHEGIKDIEECRWQLWCVENHKVQIAPHLAKTLDECRILTTEIKDLEDMTTKLIPLLKPAYMPRGNPLRVIFRGESDEDLHEVMIFLLCFVLGIRLQLFDEPNPAPFRKFKRVAGLPENWQLPPGIFELFPYLYEQSRNALLTATDDELEVAREVCHQISRILNNPDNWKRGAIVILGAALPWRLFKVAGLLWPSPVARAGIVALVILIRRAFINSIFKDIVTILAALLAIAGYSFANREPI
jgi:hypothetical protein